MASKAEKEARDAALAAAVGDGSELVRTLVAIAKGEQVNKMQPTVADMHRAAVFLLERLDAVGDGGTAAQDYRSMTPADLARLIDTRAKNRA